MEDIQSRLSLKNHPARHWRHFDEKGRVECYLCPRHCKIKDEQYGFCKVRRNSGSELVTLNYGASVQMTQEYIETEAVFHFAPGSKILSLGNIGCMMACDFCHNWQTSQMKHVPKKEVKFYTPEEVVEAALSKNIKMISWTYNDPVVWHEFVVDTARLAKKAGIKNLYKSAFYIGPEAVDELLEVIDIFSISLKSMDEDFYRKITKGKLQPVLDAIKQVYDSKKAHLEISNLVVTGRNDHMDEVTKLSSWILENLDENVPLHLVRFHPDYQYTNVERTSIPFLKSARLKAKEMGLNHVYLGNVYEEHESLNTYCSKCENLLISRFGFSISKDGVTDEGFCRKCSAHVPIQSLKSLDSEITKNSNKSFSCEKRFTWNGDINAVHVTLKNKGIEDAYVEIAPVLRSEKKAPTSSYPLRSGETWRLIESKNSSDSLGVCVKSDGDIEIDFLEVLDRAHFPTTHKDQELKSLSL